MTVKVVQCPRAICTCPLPFPYFVQQLTYHVQSDTRPSHSFFSRALKKIGEPGDEATFLVAEVEICQSPDFVIYMSNNPSSNCCCLLRTLVVLYEGEISLHFDPPSRHSPRTRSPLLWAVIRILYLDTARFIHLLYIHSPF